MPKRLPSAGATVTVLGTPAAHRSFVHLVRVARPNPGKPPGFGHAHHGVHCPPPRTICCFAPAQQDRVRKEVEQAFLRARTALLQRDLYVTTHVPQAELALSASKTAYQTGKLDFLSLIDSVRAIESAHLDHIEAEASFEKAFADLERAVGGPIERGGAQ